MKVLLVFLTLLLSGCAATNPFMLLLGSLTQAPKESPAPAPIPEGLVITLNTASLGRTYLLANEALSLPVVIYYNGKDVTTAYRSKGSLSIDSTSGGTNCFWMSYNSTTNVMSAASIPNNQQTCSLKFTYTGTSTSDLDGTYTQTVLIKNPPTNIVYSTTADSLVVGDVFVSQSPVLSGGAVTAFSVSPSLPTGLVLNSSTGAISGTLTQRTASAEYTIKASNDDGYVTFIKTIEVKYPEISASYTFTDSSVAINTPYSNPLLVSSGPVTGCVLVASLPVGLSLNTTTCTVSGTPIATLSKTQYTVTVSNADRVKNISFNLTVNNPPISLTYVDRVLVEGLSGQTISAAYAGGAASFSISPSLPTGLSFNTSTGAITGTPTARSALTQYTVTATNSDGAISSSFNLTVSDAPANLTYTSKIYRVNEIVTITPTFSGATALSTSFSVSPSLPAEFSLNTSTGVISGAPTTVYSSGSYTVTATNTDGSSSSTFTLQVKNTPTVIESGDDFTCAINNNRTVSCWGRNTYGQIGIDPLIGGGYSTTPVSIVGVSDSRHLSTGSYHVCSINSSGAVSCWGKGVDGQLGNGVKVNSTTPVSVAVGGVATEISAGRSHTCAIVGGAVKCWGDNTYGQLGNGTNVTSSSPVAVSGLSGVTAISSGISHTCAISSSTVYCWGKGTAGQLLNGSTANRNAPGITTYTSATSVQASKFDETSCLIDAGNVECLGASTLSSRSASSVRVGDGVCYLVGNSEFCVGLNVYGQIGNGANAPVSVSPYNVGGVDKYTVGGSVNCIIDSTTLTLSCAGSSTYGQLGNGTGDGVSATNSNTFTSVSGY